MRLSWRKLWEETESLVTPVTAVTSNNVAGSRVTSPDSELVTLVTEGDSTPNLSPTVTIRHQSSESETPSVYKSVTNVTSVTSTKRHGTMEHNEPEEWLIEFESWVETCCIFRDRCFGGIGVLYVHFGEWCNANGSVPCNRCAFGALLSLAGFLSADGLVYGLLLNEDLRAL